MSTWKSTRGNEPGPFERFIKPEPQHGMIFDNELDVDIESLTNIFVPPSDIFFPPQIGVLPMLMKITEKWGIQPEKPKTIHFENTIGKSNQNEARKPIVSFSNNKGMLARKAAMSKRNDKQPEAVHKIRSIIDKPYIPTRKFSIEKPIYQSRKVLREYPVVCGLFNGPGPAQYECKPIIGSYGEHDITRKAAPCYSLGYRRSEPKPLQSPGPVYNVRGLSRTGKYNPPAFTFGSKPLHRMYVVSPGPAAYFGDLPWEPHTEAPNTLGDTYHFGTGRKIERRPLCAKPWRLSKKDTKLIRSLFKKEHLSKNYKKHNTKK